MHSGQLKWSLLYIFQNSTDMVDPIFTWHDLLLPTAQDINFLACKTYRLTYTEFKQYRLNDAHH